MSFLKDSSNFKNLIDKYNKEAWDKAKLRVELVKLMSLERSSKEDCFDIYQYFKLSQLDAINDYVLAISYMKCFDFDKLKMTYVIWGFILTYLYKKDYLDQHLYIKSTTDFRYFLDQLFFLIPKITIVPGLSKLQWVHLHTMCSTEVIELIDRRMLPPLFMKVGVYHESTKDLIIALTTVEDLYDPVELHNYEALINKVYQTTSLTFNDIFNIITSELVVIYIVDKTYYENPDAKNNYLYGKEKVFVQEYTWSIARRQEFFDKYTRLYNFMYYDKVQIFLDSDLIKSKIDLCTYIIALIISECSEHVMNYYKIFIEYELNHDELIIAFISWSLNYFNDFSKTSDD